MIHAVAEKLDLPCIFADVFSLSGLTVDVPEMLRCKGSDAPIALRELFTCCRKVAPSLLVIDPLNVLAADNSSRRIDRSEMDLTFLSELIRILEDARLSGVTIIGVTSDEMHVQNRILHAFDESVQFGDCFHSRFIALFLANSSGRCISVTYPSISLNLGNTPLLNGKNSTSTILHFRLPHSHGLTSIPA